ncbi:acetaldehyde dehydrogenase (acetylating) [Pseudobacillus wudalianchiensis]|uniref:Acetaldehyde dehydrogenase (Acetylating) n=1 Tax=Pseudobacillus wudalianchiensis TaxID=1743143 RepID=A0A1B9B6R4_9BACI|nr:acetaldehyde dehydrogenase (acetylating) [Bacillus wudalianchiensis]OCA91759.1 acetaldehyde dehydrogenase (acetylating) [Bacillus wudalianchiensis]
MMLDTDLESVQEGRQLLQQAKLAQAKMRNMTQDEVDRIVHSMAQVASQEAGRLASMAVDETGYGKVEDKLTKNLFASRDVYESIKAKKTVGIISRNEQEQVWEVAEPVGIVAGIVPSTNPTSTAIFKALIAAKSRNAIVFSPHPSAAKCTNEAVKVLQEAAQRAGAPDGLISCVTNPTLASARELMNHKLTDLILATGGTDMVKAAYSSGKPAFGVGPGNVPVYIHSSANLGKAVKQIIQSKTFDYGTICASEQAIVVEQSIKRKVKRELESEGAYFLDEYEKKRIEDIILVNGRLNPSIVGKSPQRLAEMAKIIIPEKAKLLIAEETNVGKSHPFSLEKLSPILALYTVQDSQEASNVCNELLELGGLGHTIGIHAENQDIIERFGLEQKVSRVIVNSGTTFGGIGATTGIAPSMTLGCGTYGNNVSSDNIGPEHLLNTKRIAFGVREMKNEHSLGETSNQSTPPANERSISRAEVMDIVKSVLQELKL